jgi:uncharacterized protein YaaW (UPF0174 family)
MNSDLSSPFDDFYKKIRQKSAAHLKAHIFDEKMVAHIKETYSDLLLHESVVLTRNEKRRLFKDALGDVFDDIVGNS